MKRILLYRFILALSILLLPGLLSAQEKSHQEFEISKLLGAAKTIMKDAVNCALITVDEENRPRVRMMDPFIPEEDFTVWLGTNPKSRKVKQIRSNPSVTLYYTDKQDSGYVMIQGNAKIVESPLEKEKHWKEGWQQFYPDKKNGYVLIKVTPVWLEVVSYTHGILGDTSTWKPPKVMFDSPE